MCTYAKTCPEGLVVNRSTLCSGGMWQATNDCPAIGGFDDQGCPSAQPMTGAACSPGDGGGFQTCLYTKTCAATSCDDAGICSHTFETAQANCVNGKWMTTALGPC